MSASITRKKKNANFYLDYNKGRPAYVFHIGITTAKNCAVGHRKAADGGRRLAKREAC